MAFPAGSQPIGGMAVSADGALYVTLASGSTIPNPTFTGPVTATGSTGLWLDLIATGIPFVKLSSGTMGNNGALSAITALDRTYQDGCYLWFDANQIAAGVAAGWYWAVMSTTQAGTVYNSTYVSGQPVAGTTTAFATTGPGAITGSTSEVFAHTISLPVLNANSVIEANFIAKNNNSAGTKVIRARCSGSGGSIVLQPTTQTTATTYYFMGAVFNQGTVSAQFSQQASLLNGLLAGLRTAVNTGVATTLVFSMQGNTATDNITIDTMICRLRM